jgi:hypothetical protein
MKTAIAIDSLISRDEATFILELVLNLFPNSEIYTIAHKRGGILGTIETRPIVSSWLSHKVNKGDVLKKNFWVMPTVVKGIPIHPSIKKVIIISRGYIHGLNLPAEVERYLYLLDWNLIDQGQLGLQRFFAPYVNDWREKMLTHYPKIAVSSHALKLQLDLPNAEVIAPTYRTEEYPFVTDENHNFLFTHHLVHTQGMSQGEFRKLVKVLSERQQTVRVLGPMEHLQGIKKDYPLVEFAGDHCEATSALYSHQAKAIWDLSSTFFPSRGLGGLATGRPVVVRDLAVNREYLQTGAYFLSDFSDVSLASMCDQIEAAHLSVDRRVLRRHGLKWNERLFKSRMVRFLNRIAD